MSSPEELEDHFADHEHIELGVHSGPQVKKRRVQTVRACDRCRLKKIRCDGTPTPGTRCSHCVTSDSDCIFTPGTKQKRAPQKKYVDGLESRLERLEALLTRLHPDSDFSHELDLEHIPHPPHSAPASHNTGTNLTSERSRFPHVLFDEAADVDTHEEQFVPSPELLQTDDEDEDITTHAELVRKLREMNITGPLNRYYGRSSSVRLFRTALNLKSEVAGTDADIMRAVMDNAERRPDFWKLHPWERTRFSCEQKSPFSFPDPDLMEHLIASYFRLTHRMCPVLHKPTFDACLAEGKHLREEGFGAVVLLVCALGSRYVDDPRVYLDHPEKPGHPHSAGWMWFNQIQLVRNVALADPTLFDLQAMALSIMFLSGMSPPQACWTLAGIGIRMAQDVGAHRRKTYSAHTVEGELWKRAFWSLVTLDIWFSSFLGRPCAIALDSFDVEFPLECDDEYWTHPDPAQRFVQPPEKPSNVAYVVYWIKLHLIHSHALRTIYSLEKHKVIAKIGEHEWEQRVVSELDSALNRWVDSLPDHLRWDPTREDEGHFIQTVSLHAAYHLVQMTIHRPFIPSSRKASSLSFPSLTICANSARSCIHVLQAFQRRLPNVMIMNMLIPGFMAAIVLLLRIWVAKRAGLQIDAKKEMTDVHEVIRYLATGEARWSLAGRFKDLLVTLSAVGDLPLPTSPPNSKRAHPESDDERPQRISEFPPSSGLAPRKSTTLTQFSYGSLDDSRISTFGPPLAPQESDQRSLDLQSTFTPAPVFNAPTGASRNGNFGGAGGLAGPTQRSVSSSSATSSSSGFMSTASSGYVQLQENRQAYQPMNDLYSAIGPVPSQGIRVPFDTPSPPSNGPSPSTAANLGLSADLYSNSFNLEPTVISNVSENINVQQAYSREVKQPFGGAEDALGNFFAGMVPQDGQMGVGSDMVAMWSTMPSTFQSEEWDQYVTNMMGMAGGGQPQFQTRQQRQPRDRPPPLLF